MSLSTQLSEYIQACFTGIWVESHEHHDAIAEIADLCRTEDWRLMAWDIENGVALPGQNAPTEASGQDPLAAIRSINALAQKASSAVLVLQNFHRFMQSAEIVQALAKQILLGKQNRTFIVILSPIVQVPVELEKLFVVVEHSLPTRDQLRAIAQGVSGDEFEMPNGENLERVLDASVGLTRPHRMGASWRSKRSFAVS